MSGHLDKTPPGRTIGDLKSTFFCRRFGGDRFEGIGGKRFWLEKDGVVDSPMRAALEEQRMVSPRRAD